jgi:hypothetical protein
MAFPLIPFALGLGAAYLLFGKKAAAAPGVAPSSPSSPYIPPSSYTPPSGGGGYAPPSDGAGGVQPGQIDPLTGTTRIGPGGGGSYTPMTDPSGSQSDPSYFGPGAVSSGTNADPSLWDQASSLFSTSGPALVRCDEVGGWCPYYAGWEHGYPPPSGTPIFTR